MLVLVALVFWPYTQQFISDLAAPPQEQLLGTVERINYTGGYATHSLVDVGGHTLLLEGAVELKRNMLVQKRVTWPDRQLCVVGTQRCYEIVNR